MPLKLTSSQKVLMGIASVGVAFVVYDQVVNFGPAKSNAAEHAVMPAPADALGASDATPVPLVQKPRAAELLQALRTRMEKTGAREGSLRDVFAPITPAARASAHGSEGEASPGAVNDASAARAAQLGQLFVLRSVLNRAGAASATVNDAVLIVGRPARLRVGEGANAREYLLVLESVQEPTGGDRGSAVLRVNDERITLHIRE